MAGDFTVSGDITDPAFGHAWLDEQGRPHATTRFGHASLFWHNTQDPRQAAAAILATAAELGKLTGEPVTGTWLDGHALIIEFTGDPDNTDITGRCLCGDLLGNEGPTTNFNHLAGPWDEHLAKLRAQAETRATKLRQALEDLNG